MNATHDLPHDERPLRPPESASCDDDQRRNAVRDHGDWNGIDYVELDDTPTRLLVYFLGKLPREFRKDKPSLVKHVRIEGGRRVRDIRVVDVDPRPNSAPDQDDYLVVRLDREGDFSTYTLRLVDVANVDPAYDHADFSFKVDCPSDVDCASTPACVEPSGSAPEISYLAKDYASFKQLILDRMAVTMPQWTERHAADISIALVEVLAYVGDYLSYYQDAVATEAYLDTARKRISVRRHARLVDYTLHEGCNARAWVTLQLTEDDEKPLDAAQIFFLTRPPAAPSTWPASGFVPLRDLNALPDGGYDLFEPLVAAPNQPVVLRKAHNDIRFYTWGRRECCLPRGATSASLLDAWVRETAPNTPPASASTRAPKPHQTPHAPAPQRPPRALHLHPGDVLIFEEIIDPNTGEAADANRAHRHAVRLTKVTPNEDAIFDCDGLPTPVLDIEWDVVDALPFALCLSSIGRAPECDYLDPVSVARGNVILADAGWTLPPEDLGCVPQQSATPTCDCEGHPSDVVVLAGAFEPWLKQPNLVYSVPLDATSPASLALDQDPHKALPAVRVQSLDPRTQKPQTWEARAHLLASQTGDRHFVVEMDDERVAHLRFGDGDLGAQPPANTAFRATYRVGATSDLNDAAPANVGAESICYVSMRDGNLLTGIGAVRNPLPARGATPPQPIDEAKLLAPFAFRKSQLRAITADDYRALAEQTLGAAVQRAAARLNWTGSWYEADVVLDALGAVAADGALMSRVEPALEPFRRIGHDVMAHPAAYVPLQIEMQVCVKSGYLRGHVKAALNDVFSNRALADGLLGFFHPDKLTFGAGIYLSQLVAAAQAVTGVESVSITTLQRKFEPSTEALRDGVLALGPFELAQLDNDPSFPEHGTLTLNLSGGR